MLKIKYRCFNDIYTGYLSFFIISGMISFVTDDYDAKFTSIITSDSKNPYPFVNCVVTRLWMQSSDRKWKEWENLIEKIKQTLY
jgi:hypothetical protein